MSTFDTLAELISETVGIGASSITVGSSFVDDLGFDSFDQVELLIGVEEVFGFEVEDEKMDAIVTVRDAVEYIDAVSTTLPTVREE